jgi:argininosuccinate synthase
VSGEVRLLLRSGHVFVEGVSSPASLLAASRGVYGEAAGEWSAADAKGFSRLAALPSMLWARSAAAAAPAAPAAAGASMAAVPAKAGAGSVPEAS